jgi:glutathione S-transferase
MIALYGHPFSSYTWKAEIALIASGVAYEFRMVDPNHAENSAFVQEASPLGKFPVLLDGDRKVFESTSIIEYIAYQYGGHTQLLPGHAGAAIRMRMIDRVFDNYVMTPMNTVVVEHIRSSDAPDPARLEEARGTLRRSYAWLENWLAGYPVTSHITLVECAAAPSLFYADWVEPIGDDNPRLKAWRAHLLALPAVAQVVDAARPYRHFFPPGAPDRD